MVDDHREQSGRDRQVERVVAIGAAGAAEVGEDSGQLVVGLGICQLAGDEPDSLRELLPDIFPEGILVSFAVDVLNFEQIGGAIWVIF